MANRTLMLKGIGSKGCALKQLGSKKKTFGSGVASSDVFVVVSNDNLEVYSKKSIEKMVFTGTFTIKSGSKRLAQWPLVGLSVLHQQTSHKSFRVVRGPPGEGELQFVAETDALADEVSDAVTSACERNKPKPPNSSGSKARATTSQQQRTAATNVSGSTAAPKPLMAAPAPTPTHVTTPGARIGAGPGAAPAAASQVPSQSPAAISQPAQPAQTAQTSVSQSRQGGSRTHNGPTHAPPIQASQPRRPPTPGGLPVAAAPQGIKPAATANHFGHTTSDNVQISGASGPGGRNPTQTETREPTSTSLTEPVEAKTLATGTGTSSSLAPPPAPPPMPPPGLISASPRTGKGGSPLNGDGQPATTTATTAGTTAGTTAAAGFGAYASSKGADAALHGNLQSEHRHHQPRVYGTHDDDAATLPLDACNGCKSLFSIVEAQATQIKALTHRMGTMEALARSNEALALGRNNHRDSNIAHHMGQNGVGSDGGATASLDNTLEQLLSSIGLSEHISKFTHHDIDAAGIMDLDEDDWEEFGVVEAEHRSRIMNAVQSGQTARNLGRSGSQSNSVLHTAPTDGKTRDGDVERSNIESRGRGPVHGGRHSSLAHRYSPARGDTRHNFSALYSLPRSPPGTATRTPLSSASQPAPTTVGEFKVRWASALATFDAMDAAAVELESRLKSGPNPI